MIQVPNLVKAYGDLVAVKDISFEVEEGEIFAFLGPNGAGKTTIIKILTTLLKPTSGSVRLDGLDPSVQHNEARKRFGIVFQEPSLDDELTAYENMDFHGVARGLLAHRDHRPWQNHGDAGTGLPVADRTHHPRRRRQLGGSDAQPCPHVPGKAPMSAIYILWLRQVKRYVRSKPGIIASLGQPLMFLIAPGVIAMTILFTAIFSGIELIRDRQFGFLKETLVAICFIAGFRVTNYHALPVARNGQLSFFRDSTLTTEMG
jgi:hypothetical protein